MSDEQFWTGDTCTECGTPYEVHAAAPPCFFDRAFETNNHGRAQQILMQEDMTETEAHLGYKYFLLALKPADDYRGIDYLGETINVLPEPTYKAAAYKTLNITPWYDENHRLYTGLDDVLTRIAVAQRKLDPQTFLLALSTIFGADGLRTAFLLTKHAQDYIDMKATW